MSEEIIRLELLLHHTMLKKLKNLIKKLMKKKEKYNDEIPQSVKKKIHQLKYLKA